MALMALVVSVLPGVFGGLLFCSVISLRRVIPLPLLFASGAFPGFWMLSTYVDLTKLSGSTIASDILVCFFFLMVLGLLLRPLFGIVRHIASAGYAQRLLHVNSASFQTLAANGLVVLCCGGLALVMATLAQHLYMAPISAWDVLGSWSFHGRQVIDQAFIEGTVVSYGDSQSHPTAATTLLGWASWASQINGGVALWPWLLAALGIWAAIFGYAMHRGQPRAGSLVATLAVCSPLFENHVGLAGYSEVWLTLTMVTATAVLAIGLSSRNFSLVLFALFASLMCIWTRKTGMANTLTLIFATGLVGFFSADGTGRWYLLALLVVLTAWSGYAGFSFGLAGTTIEWDPNIKTLHFAGRDLKIQWQGISQVAHNELYSKFINMSFSTLFTAGVICLAAILLNNRNRSAIEISQTFVAYVFILNVALLIFTQLFSTESIKLGAINSDTGMSRFSLPAIPIVGLMAVDAISNIAKKRKYQYLE